MDISITGIVKDASTGQPIAYARITLIPGGKTATTSRNGMYIFNDLPSGNYAVQATCRGYLSSEVSAQVSSGSTTRSDISLTPDGTARTQSQEDLPQQKAEPPVVTEQAPVSVQPSSSGPDPLATVRNGLSAYFRFNNTTRSEVSAIQGNPVNAPQYTAESKDGTQALSVSSIDGSQLSFPKPLIVYPTDNYSITFWMKGFSNGHVWSLANGSYTQNYPKLVISDGKFRLYNHRYDRKSFNHPDLDYSWHFIAITMRTANGKHIASLYIDGVLTDSIQLDGASQETATKFLLGGASESGDNAIDTYFDNLRVYGSRALSDQEVAQIYMSEQ